MKIESTQGIILRATAFKEKDYILTVLSPDHGLMKIYQSRKGKKTGNHYALSTPLTCAEFLFSRGRGNLLRFQDGSVLEEHLALRKSLPHLEAACEMVNKILEIQWPGKPSPELFQLLLYFLKRLPDAEDPRPLLQSFLLKTLRLEGLLSLQPLCSHCGEENDKLFLAEGQSFCQAHRPDYHLDFSEEESQVLLVLAWSRSLQDLLAAPYLPDLDQKISALFESLVSDTVFH